MSDIKIFNNGGILYADSRNVAEVLGVEHESIMRLIKEKEELRDPFSDLKSEKSDTGRPAIYSTLTERQCLILITFVKNTEEAVRAKVALVDAFIAMSEKIKERGSLTAIDKDQKAAEIFINLVRPAESGKILLAHKVCEKHGLPTDLLPHYSEEKPTASMTELLKKFGFPYSAQAMNKKLIAAGILSEKTRKSSHGEKKFFVITENGERFGKNLVSPQNPRETQPHWFEETFAEMIKVVA